MPKPGLRKIYKYSDDFKAAAVQLSCIPDVIILALGRLFETRYELGDETGGSYNERSLDSSGRRIP